MSGHLRLVASDGDPVYRGSLDDVWTGEISEEARYAISMLTSEQRLALGLPDVSEAR